jgi:hypothetical protein
MFLLAPRCESSPHRRQARDLSHYSRASAAPAWNFGISMLPYFLTAYKASRMDNFGRSFQSARTGWRHLVRKPELPNGRTSGRASALKISRFMFHKHVAECALQRNLCLNRSRLGRQIWELLADYFLKTVRLALGIFSGRLIASHFACPFSCGHEILKYLKYGQMDCVIRRLNLPRWRHSATKRRNRP